MFVTLTQWLIPVFLSLNVALVGTVTHADATPRTPIPVTDEIKAAIARGALSSLTESDLPDIPNIGDYIVEPDTAIVLGKAFFWDMQAGNNGQACASCHFHAGADRRIKNSLHPGNRDVAVFQGDDELVLTIDSPKELFQTTLRGRAGGPNYVLHEHDFPFHLKSDTGNRDSSVVFDTDDLVGSQGVLNAEFHGVSLDGQEDCRAVPDHIFNVSNRASLTARTRRVTPRNTPTTINAALNHRNFWDGRANHIFNGVNPFGRRDPDASVWRVEQPGTNPQLETVRIDNSSLASQAVGPPLSASEMSCGANGLNRTFAHLGRKLIQRLPLANQLVHAADNALARYRAAGGLGLNVTYEELIQAAFDAQWWEAPDGWTTCGPNIPVSSNPDCFNLMEANFALFWGLSIQAYERTLISGETRFDTFVEEVKTSDTSSALTESEVRGLHTFVTDGRCLSCHHGAAFSSATVEAIDNGGGIIRRNVSALPELGAALHDAGFFYIGVRPPESGDSGLGLRQHPEAGIPLSFAAQYVEGITDRDFARDNKGSGGLERLPEPCSFDVVLTKTDLPDVEAPCPNHPIAIRPEFAQDDLSHLRLAVHGAFKVPGLRNIDLTGPYMHNGGMSTLQQVVQFYNRGGDFVGLNTAADILPLNLTADQQADLVTFLQALTDERVRHDRAPFDHPGLVIAHGHGGDENMLDCLAAFQMTDVDPFMLMDQCDHTEVLPAAGASGFPQPAARPFIDILRSGF